MEEKEQAPTDELEKEIPQAQTTYDEESEDVAWEFRKVRMQHRKQTARKIIKISIYIIIGVLFIFLLFSTLGGVMETDELKQKVSQLENEKEEISQELEDLRDYYNDYKNKMQPYEELEAAEAQARLDEAKKAEEEKKAKEAAEAEAAAKAAAEEQAKKDAIEKASTEQKNALNKAKDYLRSMAFSYSGLVQQLEYEGYSNESATFAVDNCGADWNEQAAKKAKNYMDSMSFSRQGLLDQLIYEGFSNEQAEYGVSAVGY